MGSFAHRGQGKVLKLFRGFFFQQKDAGLVATKQWVLRQRVYSHSQNPCSLGFMPIPKTPLYLLFTPTLSASSPLQSGDNSNCNTHLKQPPRYTWHSKHQPLGAVPQLPGEAGSPETQTLFREALKRPAPPRRQTTPAQPDTRGDERYQRLLLPEVLLPFQRQLHF